jgi:DNA-binding transcriptional ArsR family regulator
VKHQARQGGQKFTADDLLALFGALANPQRLRVLRALYGERRYVSQLARDMGMSRPLLHMHLRKLEAAGLITGSIEVSEDGKAMKFYEVADFDIAITPRLVADAAAAPVDSDGKDGD